MFVDATGDGVQLEWSTKTYTVVLQLFESFSASRATRNVNGTECASSSTTDMSLLSFENQISDGCLQNEDLRPNVSSKECPSGDDAVQALSQLSLKLDISNFNVLVCESTGGRFACFHVCCIARVVVVGRTRCHALY